MSLMEWPTIGEWIAIVAIIVTISLIAGFIEAWQEQRKREKEHGKKDRL